MILIKKLAGHATALVPLGVVAEYVLANIRAKALKRRNNGHH